MSALAPKISLLPLPDLTLKSSHRRCRCFKFGPSRKLPPPSASGTGVGAPTQSVVRGGLKLSAVSPGTRAEGRTSKELAWNSPPHKKARERFKPGPLPSQIDDLVDFSVVLESSGRRVGIVAQVVSAGEGRLASRLLRVVNKDVDLAFGEGLQEEHLIPLVPQIVVGVDWSHETVLLRPPKGLLRLGRQRLIISYLKPILLEIAADIAKAEGRVGALRMPSKKDLVKAGRWDLVKLVVRAGGFPAVANGVGLISRRRPNGYWEDLDNLDHELSQFISESWRQFQNQEGIRYFYNTVTGQTAWDAPTAPTRIELDDMGSYVMVEDERDRVMPTAAAVRSAGRYSLHLAICMHGGYAAVAEALDRRRCWPRYPNLREDLGTLRAELVDFARREGLERGSMPTLTMLRDAGRTDLFSTVACMGGPRSVAQKLGLKTQRKGRGSMADFEFALEEFERYLKETGHASDILPTQSQLRAEGRHDLRYALQLHGGARLAAALGLRLAQGRRSGQGGRNGAGDKPGSVQQYQLASGQGHAAE